MTTINRAIRKANKKAERQMAKRNRRESIDTHNLTHAHQQLIEAESKTVDKVVDFSKVWETPFRQHAIKQPSLSNMFFLDTPKK